MTRFQSVSSWLRSSLGRMLLNSEEEALQPYWSEIEGEDLLFLGDPLQLGLTEAHHLFRMLVVSSDYYSIIGMRNMIFAQYEALPVAPNSMSAIFLPHLLEFSDTPRKILSEAEIVLQPNGALIIVGFNPFSLFGLRRLFSRRKSIPWSGEFYSVWKVKRWLQSHGFELMKQSYAFYSFPTEHMKRLRWTKGLTWFLKVFCPMLGGVYCISARKKAFGVMPLRMDWESISEVVNDTVAKPITRGLPREHGG